MATLLSSGSWGHTPAMRRMQRRRVRQLASQTASLLETKANATDGVIDGDIQLEGQLTVGDLVVERDLVPGEVSGRLRQRNGPYSVGFLTTAKQLTPALSDAIADKVYSQWRANPEAFGTLPPNVQMRHLDVASSPVGIVAVGYNFADKGSFSENGYDWQRITEGLSSTIGNFPARDWGGITWSQDLGLFCALANSGTQLVATSPDGKSWTLRDTAVIVENCNAHADISNGVVCRSTEYLDPGMTLYLVSGSGTVSGQVSTIVNSTTFTTTIALTGLDDSTLGANHEGSYLTRIVWSSELRQFCSVFSNNPGGLLPSSQRRVLTSPDGIHWTWQKGGQGSLWNNVIWAKELGLWVATGYGGPYRIMTSPDGVNWSYPSQPEMHGTNNWAVAWSPQLRLLCAGAVYTGITRVALSRDGSNWEILQAPWKSDNRAIDMLWLPDVQRFYVVSYTASSAPDFHWVSADGRTWERIPALSASIEMGGATWSNEHRFIIAGSPYGTGDGATVYRIMRTTLRGRIPSPLNVFGLTANRISENGVWQLQSVLKRNLTYVSGSTTPSVARCVQFLQIANATATSITDFTYGETHQELTLVFSDSNTTLIHNPSLLCLRGGVNFVSSANDVVVLVRSSAGVWLEVSRSLNG
jgi:hypothetical protein